MKIGTCHFHSLQGAQSYFAKQNLSPDDVQEKLDCGEIYIGLPSVNNGESIELDSDGRYVIVAESIASLSNGRYAEERYRKGE